MKEAVLLDKKAEIIKLTEVLIGAITSGNFEEYRFVLLYLPPKSNSGD